MFACASLGLGILVGCWLASPIEHAQPYTNGQDEGKVYHTALRLHEAAGYAWLQCVNEAAWERACATTHTASLITSVHITATDAKYWGPGRVLPRRQQRFEFRFT